MERKQAALAALERERKRRNITDEEREALMREQRIMELKMWEEEEEKLFNEAYALYLDSQEYRYDLIGMLLLMMMMMMIMMMMMMMAAINFLSCHLRRHHHHYHHLYHFYYHHYHYYHQHHLRHYNHHHHRYHDHDLNNVITEKTPVSCRSLSQRGNSCSI